jgi:NAD(P)-dependent dehydrogenase (short-subunit alcohol dehydrogenase family)
MELFNLTGKNAVILGGGGVLGSAMTKGLAIAGASIAVCSLKEENANAAINSITSENIKKAAYSLNALDMDDLKKVCSSIMQDFGKIDILVNAVGGNLKDATTTETQSFFDLSKEAIEKVINLNLMGGAVMPSQVFGKEISQNPDGGVIINISSMNSLRPLTRIPGYSAAKAAVSNFTQWLATDMAFKFGEKVRVNAIAPGFFLTEQNKFLLTDVETGELTARGKTILSHTPMGRFGDPQDLVGTLIWLASDASKFVTGIVVPVDGGFSAFSGV